jgi:hypothetical protein
MSLLTLATSRLVGYPARRTPVASAARGYFL